MRKPSKNMDCLRQRCFARCWTTLGIVAAAIAFGSAPTLGGPPGLAPAASAGADSPDYPPALAGGDAAHHFEAIQSIMKIARANGLKPGPEQCEQAMGALEKVPAGTEPVRAGQDPGQRTTPTGSRTDALQAAHLACDELADKICGDYWEPNLGRACYALAN